jgi:hypothetical protein
MGQLEIAYVDGMKVGLGYNMLTGTAAKSTAVTVTSVTAPAEAGGSVTKLTLAIVQDNESFKQTLGVNADVSGSYMGFEANAKMDFADSCNGNSNLLLRR